MKKVYVPIIIVIFGICAFFGYKAAANILSDRQIMIDQTTANVNPPVVQQNFVFIHVDDLSITKPQLISIWAGFVNESSPPQLLVLPLYPTDDIEVHDRVNKNFSVAPDSKKIKPRFISQLRSTFDFKIDGYILSDDTGVAYSNKLLSGIEMPLSSIPTTTDSEKHSLLQSEKTSWQQFCNLVSLGTSNSYFSVINWGVLLPDHFSTDLEFERITLLTDQIIRAADKVQCEVIANK